MCGWCLCECGVCAHDRVFKPSSPNLFSGSYVYLRTVPPSSSSLDSRCCFTQVNLPSGSLPALGAWQPQRGSGRIPCPAPCPEGLHTSSRSALLTQCCTRPLPYSFPHPWAGISGFRPGFPATSPLLGLSQRNRVGIPAHLLSRPLSSPWN